MLNSRRRAGLSAAGVLAVMAAAGGLLVGAILVPVVGALGVGVRDAATTFNTLAVPSLGQLPSRSEILDNRGHLIAYYYPNNIDRVPVSYSQIAPVMRNAIVAVEDSRFYKHGAFDIRGTARAIVNDLRNTDVQGGSTLAQQYVKNALILTAKNAQQERDAYAPTPSRKIRELRMASIVAQELTKNQLLAGYLSVAYFANGARGVQVAAERYFGRSAKRLTLTQSALLAGIVENPSAYDPVRFPKNAIARRNLVLTKMYQQHYITKAAETKAMTAKLRLHVHNTSLESGCTSHSARHAAFFCDFVLSELRNNPAYATAYHALTTVGGLTIHTTLSPRDQAAANHAVNFVQPWYGGTYNPGHNADTEVLITPGSGKVRAIAENRLYGSGPGHTTVDYAVDARYDGGSGVQQGSSAKIFTLITALKQNLPFGYTEKVTAPVTLTPYFGCKGQQSIYKNLQDAEGPTLKGAETFTLYNGTTRSINVFYGQLEQHVGLCNVVRTAASMGAHRATGQSLFSRVKSLGKAGYSADTYPSFTLGSGAYMSPMTMANVYATVASNGVYCKPIAIASITTSAGRRVPVQSAGCHRVLSKAVATAAAHILQGVLLSPGTAAGRGIGRPAAAKTGTGNDGDFADFAGFTPTLAAYVSVFNPENQFTWGRMLGERSAYREVSGGLAIPGQMFGDNAPGATWMLTFLHAALGPAREFPAVPVDSLYYSKGTGVNSPTPPKPKKGHGGGGHGHGHGPGPGGPGGTGGPPKGGH